MKPLSASMALKTTEELAADFEYEFVLAAESGADANVLTTLRALHMYVLCLHDRLAALEAGA